MFGGPLRVRVQYKYRRVSYKIYAANRQRERRPNENRVRLSSDENGNR